MHDKRHYFLNHLLHDVPELGVNTVEARLLARKRPSLKDGLQIKPLPLNLVQLVQINVEV